MRPSPVVLERAFVDDATIARAFSEPARLADAIEAIEAAAANPSEALTALVRCLGEAGVLALAVDDERVSVRDVCLARESLGYISPLADLALAMQGLGACPITLGGRPDQKRRYLPRIRGGKMIAAFAITEPDAGSDLSRLSTHARRSGDDYILEGQKTFISNAGIAHVYCVFAVTAPGTKRPVSAFIVPADAPGMGANPQQVLGGHPIGSLTLDGVRVPSSARLGAEGDGMGLALGTLGRFRTTVGAAAVGFAQRALDETLEHVSRREQFGGPLADLPAVQLRLADMACATESARLLVYRAAHAVDADAPRDEQTRLVSMAKLIATENAQQVIDHAVQLHGGRGVLTDSIVARLYQEVRALRIYEGTSDIQRLLIAKSLLGTRTAPPTP